LTTPMIVPSFLKTDSLRPGEARPIPACPHPLFADPALFGRHQCIRLM
jgi:hypothetical protein